MDITDAVAAGEGIEVFDLDAMQLQSVPLRARRVLVRLERATVVFHTTNVPLTTRTRVLDGLLVYTTFGPHTDATANGLRLRPDVMLAAGPGAEARIVTNAGYESLALLMQPDELRTHLAVRQRERDLQIPSGVQTLHAEAGKLRALYAWGKRLIDTAVRQPELFDEHPEERTAAHLELIENLLATLGNAGEVDAERSDRTRRAYSRIVKLAEEHALSRIGERLFVTDLCRAAAVSERTLENAFNEIMGMSPMTFLVRLRLHRVRKALIAGTQGSTTVSAEAMKWGFWHFGEFSRAYKACFGEAPSETLRKKAVEPST
jgi:AraC-like DNA-binding protein